MNRIGITLAVLMAFMLCIATAHASNTIINNVTTLKIVGLPPGANAPLQIQNPLGIYNIVNYPITNWTTVLTIPYNTTEMNTYHGQIPYQWMGAGTTLTYHGTTYTINESAGAGFNGFIMSNTLTYVLPFYAYFNQSVWNATQANELIAAGVNALTAMQIANVSTTYNTIAYGTAKVNGNYLSAGNVLNYATLTKQQSNANLNFVSSNVVSNQSYICINVTSQYYNGNLCKPGIYQLPIPELNGHFGLKFGGTATSTSITVTLQSSLIGSQKVQYNGIIQVGSNTITLSSNANSFSSSNTFTYYIGEPLNITLDANGNSNYSAEDPSFTKPSGVTTWYNITVVNNDPNNALIAYNGLNITLNPGAGMEPYASGAFTNWVVFNGYTGNILYSWLGGSTANEFLTYGLNTVNSLWIEVNPDFTVAAGATDNNALTLGFYSMATNSLNGNNIGENPLLECPTAITGGATTCGAYGKYDNGANVFIANGISFYQNFACPSGAPCSAPTGWNGGAGGGLPSEAVVQPSNGVTIYGGQVAQGNYISTITAYGGGTILDMFGNFPSPGDTGGKNIGYDNLPNGNNHYVLWNSETDTASTPAGVTYSIGGSGNKPAGIYGSQLWSIAELPTQARFSFNFGAYNTITTTSAPASNILFESASAYNVGTFYWTAFRQFFYDNPTFTVGVKQSSVSGSTLTLSNTAIDQGQGILFTGSQTGGTPTYSFAYNVYAYNAQTTSTKLIANQLYTGNTYSSNAFFWQPSGNLYIGNSLFFANVVINGVNSISHSFGYNAALTTPSITSNTPFIFVNNYEAFTANFMGGTSSYTYNYQVVNSLGLAYNALYNGVYGTSNIISFQPLALGTYYANVIVTDSASTPVTENSVNSIITVISLPTITIQPSTNQSLISGQTITFTITAQGGSGLFTAELNNLTGGTQQGTNVLITSIGGSNSITITTASPSSANVFKFNWTITDIGATPYYTLNSTKFSISVSAQGLNAGGSGGGGSPTTTICQGLLGCTSTTTSTTVLTTSTIDCLQTPYLCIDGTSSVLTTTIMPSNTPSNGIANTITSLESQKAYGIPLPFIAAIMLILLVVVITIAKAHAK